MNSTGTSPAARFGVGSATARDVLLAVLSAEEPMSRKQVGDRLGLSSATITKAVSYLIDAGYLEQDPMREADRPGRRETPLRVNSERCHFVGVSIQDDGQLCGALVDLSGETVLMAEEVFGASAVDDVVKAVNQVVECLATEGGVQNIRGLGVAVGGQVDSNDGVVRTSWNFDPPWQDVALARRLRRATGLEVVIENDADALVAFEQRFGSGRNRENFVVVRVTEVGVGVGIVAHGMRLHGEDGLNGELGHAEMDPSPEATKCRCGSRGCLEAFIAVAMRSRSWKNKRKAEQVVREAGDAMGRALAQLQLTNASSRLIVGAAGDNVIHDPSFQEAAYAAFQRRPFMLPAKRVIEWQRVSEADVARGAASLLFQHLSFEAQ